MEKTKVGVQIIMGFSQFGHHEPQQESTTVTSSESQSTPDPASNLGAQRQERGSTTLNN